MNEDLLRECDAFIAEHKRKADSNERCARWATGLLATLTAAIPVLLIASTEVSGFVLGKLLPAVFAAASAVIAGLLQFERPHERWSLYRRYQRLFEAERLRYVHRVGLYAEQDADDRFSEWLARNRLAVHDEWAALVPASEQVAQIGASEDV